MQNTQADFSNYRTAIHHEEMTSSDESNKRKIEAFNLDDLTSNLTDTDVSESRSKTPTSPKITRALRQLDIAKTSPSKRRQGELFAHINHLTFEEEEILRSNTNAAREDVMGQGILSGIRRVNKEESERLLEDLMKNAKLFDPAEMMPMFEAIRNIQVNLATVKPGELLDDTLVRKYKRIHDIITNTLNDERSRQELLVTRSKSELYDQRQASRSFIDDDRLVEIPNYYVLFMKKDEYTREIDIRTLQHCKEI